MGISNHIFEKIYNMLPLKWLPLLCFTFLVGMHQPLPAQKVDWLIQPPAQKASIYVKNNQLVLNNGLVQRVFLLSPNASCIS